MMPRNLERRVEVAVPVTETPLRSRLDEIFALSLADDELAWTFDGGTWTRVSGDHVNAQVTLAEHATRRNRAGA